MPTDESDSLSPGALFAQRYDIVKRLGEGAFGAVYEARMRPMMRRVAIKVLHPEVAGETRLTVRTSGYQPVCTGNNRVGITVCEATMATLRFD